ncbi:hypothetical protein V5799_009206 [Amblyomma americanum]|uniref:Uncharacterized protein n=1 Tax=Amblyomma americanum TaxID=6943 RepID=A0AAQ4FCU8_AMBAM
MHFIVTSMFALLLALGCAVAAPISNQEQARHGSDHHGHDRPPLNMAIDIPNLFQLILRRGPEQLKLDLQSSPVIKFQVVTNPEFPAAVILKPMNDAGNQFVSSGQPLVAPSLNAAINQLVPGGQPLVVPTGQPLALPALEAAINQLAPTEQPLVVPPENNVHKHHSK